MRLNSNLIEASVFDKTIDHYRLTAWPSDAFLIGSPIRALLTGLLEREPLTVGRLATLSGETVNSCRDFLLDLEHEGVVDILREEATLSDFPPLINPVKLNSH
ncbi:hypothetical protein [Nitrogeniibacter aestuarii]|uniref:hypothetical protein n=1 Tax=Nitrogeniibacter aestuarii TaxID=2815343 RepID=UPI001D110CB9|nr:hypothetical protein [Nitrogeniibacter aestuarii]